MGKASQGRSRRQRRAARASGEGAPAATPSPGPVPRGLLVARAGVLVLGLLVATPLVARFASGRPVGPGWVTVGLTAGVLLAALVPLLVLPVGLTRPKVVTGPSLIATTFQGPRQVRLDALARVGAVEFAARRPVPLVRLRDHDGRRLVALLGSYQPVPAGLQHAAAALARRDPDAVSSRARHYLGLPGAPGRGRRSVQAAATCLVVLAWTVALIAVLVAYASLLS